MKTITISDETYRALKKVKKGTWDETLRELLTNGQDEVIIRPENLPKDVDEATLELLQKCVRECKFINLIDIKKLYKLCRFAVINKCCIKITKEDIL